jgi:hypothetical protein
MMSVFFFCGVLLLSPENQHKIADLHAQLHRELPGVLWTIPDITQQHITLFEIVMCLGEYSEDQDAIFERCRMGIDTELRAIAIRQGPIGVTLDRLEASPATIIGGTDDVVFNAFGMRSATNIYCPRGQEHPPDIIHSSLARYIKEVTLERVRSIVTRHQLKLTQTVTEFEMVKIFRPPMDYSALGVYKLASSSK